MKRQVRFNGKLKLYMQWTLVISILFVVLTVLLFFIDKKSGFISLAFVFAYLGIGLFLYFKSKPGLINELINYSMDFNQVQRRLLHELTMPYALLDEEGRFVWMNRCFQEEIKTEKYYSKSITTFFPTIKKDNLPMDQERVFSEERYEDKEFKIEMKKIILTEMAGNTGLVSMDNEGYLIAVYLHDITRMNYFLRENEEQKLVAGLIYLDNYEEALETVEEVKRALLIALIDRKINKWISDVDGIAKKVEKDKYFVVLKQKYLTQIQKDKFSILDEVKKVNIGNKMSVTLSIGIGAKGITYSQNYMFARAAIDLALGRGGDQAVVKRSDKIYYYGGKSRQVEKSTRVKARVKAQALREIMETKDKVFVMGHQRADIDSFGASIGIYKAAKVLDKEVYIVLDELTSSIKPMMECFRESKDYPEDMFISGEEAKEQIDINSVLVVVDVNKPGITECKELLEIAKTVVVFDHHRQGEEGIQNAVLSYIEPYASSTCEMVAEILQYFNEEIKLKNLEADCLYAGIMVDTNNFMSKTGVRTFEAAAYLRRCGADAARVHNLYRENFETYRIKAEAVSAAELFEGRFAIAVCNAKQAESPTVLGAQTANELLNILGVQASFVLTEYNSQIYISARSLDEVNVQLIMEGLNGGGHMNTAAAQIEHRSIAEAKDILKDLLRNMIKEGDL